ncbi:trehalose-phosphatase [Halobacterium jilantaiense]|uniref:Trehalose-phosphatase/alpha,alpha-trehalose-phosphate synthase [UDP-forming],TIGR02400 n=1 Tax=Halobacterium jilantaiense TaxID=355548 RepID=A0A1I0P8J9_9EURY|nr:trehalose-phosphatase [Halobacterium jilantaiense]SEW09864.1 trehalose-phosphatase/alpha,alpha-trehalose-phosphate synthase [UDP-forming],TIGR02400 [Halobacterium jilantaiense]
MNEHDDESDGIRVPEALDGRELLVASNREPYTHSYDDDGDVTVSRPAGGLTAALDPIMQVLSGTWVAWGSGDADFDVADDEGRVGVPPDDPAYTVRRLHLTDRQLSGYYYGFSNQVLWPLCHGMPTRATFDDEFWDFYTEVNETFADALVDSAETDDPVVWFQDYHLAHAPRHVREELPDAFLTQFWHVPWPSWGTFRSCPQHRELLTGLLANDVLGFHDETYCQSFFECVEAAFDDVRVDRDAGEVAYGGHTTRVQSQPLGIDADAHAGLAATEAAESFWASFGERTDLGDQVAVGVDRLDYTKGILQRLDALEYLWAHSPERRGTLTYVQKGSESRSRIDEYRELQADVERRVEEINDRFGTDDWTPVVYDASYYAREELAALYRHADVALVSPLRDGMNLVAKEYVAAQLGDDGVLVLSEFAGAVESLGEEALVVNPNDTAAFATAIEAALSMPERTRRRRMRALRRQVHGEDTDAWIDRQFEGVRDDRSSEDGDGKAPRWQSTPVSVWGRKQWLRERLQAADGLFVMTDFDGTVADIVDDPEDAAMRERAREALEGVTAHPRGKVAVVSGRAVEDVRERAGVDGAYYAGNHGLELDDGDEVSVHSGARGARQCLPEVCEAVEQAFAHDDVVVEDKGVTATVHYRQADVDGDRARAVVESIVTDHDPERALRLTAGKQIVELRPDVDWGKGACVDLLREQYTPDDESWLTVYVGDDTTDEAAFEALDGDGVAVAVGSDTDATAAPCVVSDPREVTDLLGWLAGEGLTNLEAPRCEDTVVELN